MFVATAIAGEVKTTDVDTTSSSSGAQEMATRLQTVHQCKDKVWPRFNLGDYPTYLVNHNQKPAQISEMDAKSGTVKEPSSDARKYISGEGEKAYSVGVPSKDGKNGVAVNATPDLGNTGIKTPVCKEKISAYNSLLPKSFGSKDPTDLPMDILVHEAYHSVDQNPEHVCNHTDPTQWSKLSGDRDIRADAATKSTVSTYRAHMLYFLTKAAKEPSSRKQSISEALGWYKKMTDEFPNAVKELNSVDRREGSASYVGTQAVTLSKVGCNSDSLKHRKAFLELADHRLSSTPQSLERQAYGLGAIVGLLLDEAGDKSWKNEVERGKTPMDVLASRSIAAPATSPNKVAKIVSAKKTFDAAMACFNVETMAPVEDALKNPDKYIAVALPASGQFEKEGDPIKKGNSMWMPSYSVSSGDNKVQIQQWPVSLTGECGGKGPSAVVLVPKSSIENNGTSMSFNYSVGSEGEQRSVAAQDVQKGEMKSFNGFQLQCTK